MVLVIPLEMLNTIVTFLSSACEAFEVKNYQLAVISK